MGDLHANLNNTGNCIQSVNIGVDVNNVVNGSSSSILDCEMPPVPNFGAAIRMFPTSTTNVSGLEAYGNASSSSDPRGDFGEPMPSTIHSGWSLSRASSGNDEDFQHAGVDKAVTHADVTSIHTDATAIHPDVTAMHNVTAMQEVASKRDCSSASSSSFSRPDVNEMTGASPAASAYAQMQPVFRHRDKTYTGKERNAVTKRGKE